MENPTQGNITITTFVSADHEINSVQILAKSFGMYKVGEWKSLYLWTRVLGFLLR